MKHVYVKSSKLQYLNADEEVATFDSDAWEDWEQEVQKQNQQMYDTKDEWLKPGTDQDDWDSNWSVLNKDSLTQSEGGPSSPLSPINCAAHSMCLHIIEACLSF